MPKPGLMKDQCGAMFDNAPFHYSNDLLKVRWSSRSTLKKTDKAERKGAAFLSPFLFADEKKGVGVRG